MEIPVWVLFAVAGSIVVTSAGVEKWRAWCDAPRNEADTYGYRVEWHQSTPFLFIPTVRYAWKTRQWPNDGMDRYWTGKPARPFVTPLNRAGYERCGDPVWEDRQ